MIERITNDPKNRMIRFLLDKLIVQNELIDPSFSYE